MPGGHRSFLIINPFGIGDVLFSTPLIRNLKESFPACKIAYLCNRRAYPVIKNNPLLDNFFIYERDEFKACKDKSGLLWIKKIFNFIGDIKKEKFDTVFDLSLNSQFGFFAWAAGIKKRLGFDYKKRGRFLTHKMPIDGFEDKHVIEYYLDLLQFIGISPRFFQMQLFVSQADTAFADAFFSRHSLNDKDIFICLAPGGGKSFGNQAYRKLWPLANFVKLSQLLLKDSRLNIAILLGPQEQDMALAFPKSNRLFIVSDATIMQVAALIKKCGLFISNDSGLMRIANALDRKIIAIFGPVKEKVYSPYPYDVTKQSLIRKDLPCSPCYRHFRLPPCPYDLKCLSSIEVEEVFIKAKQLLGI